MNQSLQSSFVIASARIYKQHPKKKCEHEHTIVILPLHLNMTGRSQMPSFDYRLLQKTAKGRLSNTRLHGLFSVSGASERMNIGDKVQ